MIVSCHCLQNELDSGVWGRDAPRACEISDDPGARIHESLAQPTRYRDTSIHFDM